MIVAPTARRAELPLFDAPPPGWDDGVSAAYLSHGYAEACRDVGYRPLYAADARDAALVLIRDVPLPIVRGWTARAKIFSERRDPAFLRDLVAALRRRRVSHVEIGYRLHPWQGAWPEDWPGLTRVLHHVYVIERIQRSDDALLAAMSERQRKGVRKALRERVEVVQISTDTQVQAFRGLLAQTAGRIRAHGVRMVYPPAFFMGALRHMVARGNALFLMAQAEGEPLAAHLYFVSRNKLTYYHGVSTRDRRLTPKQGPSALFWHALRLARERGFSELDMGGVCPTEDRHDPQFGVTDFKRQWGTTLRDVEIGELVLSRARVAVQDRLLAPLWEHAHPLYTRLFARGAAA